MNPDSRIAITLDSQGGRGIFIKGNNESEQRIAEQLLDFVKPELNALFEKAAGFQEHDEEEVR